MDRTSLQVHSRFSSPYDWYTRSELYPEAETAQPGQRGTTRIHRHRKSTHTLGNGDTTQQPARDSEGELAAAAAAPPPPPPPPLLLLLLLLLLCCCCVAAVLLLLLLLLLDPRCIAEHNPSQQTVSRFVFYGTHSGASNGTAAAAAVVATARRLQSSSSSRSSNRGGQNIRTSILLDIRRGDVSTIFSYGLSSPSGGPRCCCDSCAKKGLPCCRRLRRLRRHRHHSRRCCFCCAAAAAAAAAAAVVTYGNLFVFLKKCAVLRDASRSLLFSIRDY